MVWFCLVLYDTVKRTWHWLQVCNCCIVRKCKLETRSKQLLHAPLCVRKYFVEESLLVLLARNLKLLLDEARPVLVPAELHRVP